MTGVKKPALGGLVPWGGTLLTDVTCDEIHGGNHGAAYASHPTDELPRLGVYFLVHLPLKARYILSRGKCRDDGLKVSQASFHTAIITSARASVKQPAETFGVMVVHQL